MLYGCGPSVLHLVVFFKFWPRGNKTLFMLNSAEHEICLANKFQITNNSKYVLLNIAEHEYFSANKYENAKSREIFMLS